ncbi:hypothetical protein KA005_85125, partial [bacterium]|nr:hypothetical protein [bacterium]
GAVFSKEFGLIMLPIFFLFSRFVSNKSYGFVKESTIYLPFIILSILYFILRKNATDSVLTPSDMGDLLHRLYFTPCLIMLNLKLIFFPVELHSFMINYPDAYLTWQALAGFTCLVLLGLFLWKSRKNNVVSLALYSFLLALFPIMNIIPTWSVTLIYMRWLYFPMAFLSLALPVYIIKFIKINRFLTLAIFGLVVSYFGVYSYILNKNLWHDEGTFFVQEVQSFKNNYYAYGYAVNLLNKKDYQEAERYFRIAINHQPHEAKNYINYAALLIAIERPDTALLYLNKAKPLKMIDCERGQWFNNIGMAYFKLNKQDEAL